MNLYQLSPVFFTKEGCNNTDINFFQPYVDEISTEVSRIFTQYIYFTSNLHTSMLFRDMEFYSHPHTFTQIGSFRIPAHKENMQAIYNRAVAIRDAWRKVSKAYAWLSLHDKQVLLFVDSDDLPSHINDAWEAAYALKGRDFVDAI